MTKRAETYDGHCAVCGEWATFTDMSASIRETYQCQNCRASYRERVTAEAILAVHSRALHTSLASLAQDVRFSSLSIYEPGVAGAYRRFLSGLPHYRNSFFWEGLSPGEERDGVPHEDLMALSLKDASTDLIISSDIFEHVRRPWVAFKETRRVLKLGGHHIFSIPSFVPMASLTTYRVDTSTDEDIHLKEPYYHGDGRGGKSLVYTEYGADFFEKMLGCGFQVMTIRADHVDAERTRVNAFVAQAI